MLDTTLSRRSLVVGSAATLLAVKTHGSAVAQEAGWQQIEPTTSAPLPRWDHHLGADVANGALLVFGGRDNDGNALGDTWHFDLDTGTWTLLDIEGPSARFGSATASDDEHNRFWLFGGEAGSTFFNDTWRFDFGAGLWRLQHDGSISAPSPRYGLGAVYTTDGKFVISHGFTFEGRFDDTWVFDAEGKQWSDITPAATRPLNRCLHEMVTSESGQIVLYGGCSSGFGPCPQGDLWNLDRGAAAWTELTPSASPPPRSNPSLVWSEVQQHAVLFGGQTDAGKTADVWTGEFDGNAATWSALELASAGPAPRSSHDAVIIGDTMYVFGGLTDGGAANDLWALTF